MTRAFFTDVREALLGFLPRAQRDLEHRIGGSGLKVWRASGHEHFEVQRLSGTVLKAAGVTASSALEIGFHSEHPHSEENEAVAALLRAKERAWRARLGAEAVVGPFVGRREQRERWRRASELWTDGDLAGEGAAMEAAERLADYIVALSPIVEGRAHNTCTCWRP